MSKAKVQARMVANMAENKASNPTPDGTELVGQPTHSAKSLEQIMADNQAAQQKAKEDQYGTQSNVTSIAAGTQTPGERKVSSALAAILEKAAAKNAEKGAAEKEESEPKKRGGNRYIIFDETKIRAKLSPQGLFIMTELMNAGDVGLTKKELTEKAIAAGQEKFPTSQPHDRAIGFYLSAFKNEGSLAFATGPAPVETKPAETTDVAPATDTADARIKADYDEDENEGDESEDEDEGTDD